MVASIEFIERVVAMFGEAAEANLSTPSREGNVVVLHPETASEVMITGDIHGNRKNFNAIRRIADLERYPRRHLILQEVCHGGPTYPSNGGCMSHLVLEDVARLKVQFPDRVHFILGNHELSELTDYPIQNHRQILNLMFRLGLQQMYGPAAEKVREASFGFIRTSPLAVRISGGIFVSHSIPEGVDVRPFDKSIFGRELDWAEYCGRTAVFELVWGRDYRPENARAFAEIMAAQVLINGHEPCEQGYATPNPTQLILDCCGERGCYVILPTDREWSQGAVVERVQRLGG